MKKFILIIVLTFFCGGVQAQVQDTLEKVDTLNAAIVRTDKQKRAARTQTSLQRLDAQKLNRGFAVLGSPDLIKTLQTLPGVSGGTELSSGLYVRGGDGSDNLYLLDGVPLYQVSHLIGLFSSFNMNMVEEVDFYKGGFPARYGGRLSSVVDVDVRNGNFTKWKGSASLGLADGSFQIEGPIVKNKTSLSFGFRRTWSDLAKALARPLLKMNRDYSAEADEAVSDSHYDFGDYNLKIVHLFSPVSKLSFSAYYGHDFMVGKSSSSSVTDDGERSSFSLKSRMIWGNAMASLRWDRTWEEKSLATDSKLYYTLYRSDIGMNLDMYERNKDEEMGMVEMTGSLNEKDFSRIHDIGAASDWFYDAWEDHHVRFGCSGVAHIYDPFRRMDMTASVGAVPYVQENASAALHYLGGETSLYVEDEVSVGEWLQVNVGLRDALFIVKERSYNRVEPRLAVKADISPAVSLKGSYSKMNQFSHLVSSLYIDIPTSLWMPSTSLIKPMSADQVVLGAVFSPSENLKLDVEGFYKKMEHLYEYNGTNTLLPSLDKWEIDYVEGRGRAYGVELSVEYTTEKLQASAYYTLSKNERLFPTYYYSWYPDRNDNTHKINLSALYRFSPKFEVYAHWTYHTGNRFTAASLTVWDESYSSMVQDIFDMPNNYRLPDYHRLDVGLNWHKKLSNGHIRTLNLSVYNAYNRLNAIAGGLQTEDDGKKVQGVAYGIIPILPTFSYIWKF